MLYPICPTCGSLLSNIQLAYQKDIRDLCDKYNIDPDTLSKGTLGKQFDNERIAILNKYTDRDRICCRMRLSNFSDLVRIVG
jgi:hypothetical protein